MRVRVFLLFSLLMVIPAFGHDDDISVESTEVTKEQFMEFAHEANELDDPRATKLQVLLGRLDFYRKTVNAVRVRQMGAHTSAADDAANLGFLLPISHLSETLSGPLYYAYGVATGVPSTVLIPTTAFLGSMAVPGIDWGCIIFIGTYIGSKDFRDAVTGFRIYTVKTAKALGPYTGISQFLSRLVVHKSVDEHLRRALQRKFNAEYIHRESDLAHEFTFLTADKKPFSKIQLRATNDGAFMVTRMTFERDVLNANWTREDFNRLRAHFSKLLFPYGLDIRDAALTSFDAVWNSEFSGLAASLPVAAVECSENGQRIRWCKKHGECDGGHGAEHHHGHEAGVHHHHHLKVVREVIAEKGAEGFDVAVDFLPNAVQIHPVMYFRLNKALREIPQQVCEVAATYYQSGCQGIRNLASGTIWLVSHPQYVVYGPVKGVAALGYYGAKATVKTTKIGLQVIHSAVGILVSATEFVDTSLTAFATQASGWGKWLKSCVSWLVRTANSGDEDHPASKL